MLIKKLPLVVIGKSLWALTMTNLFWNYLPSEKVTVRGQKVVIVTLELYQPTPIFTLSADLFSSFPSI